MKQRVHPQLQLIQLLFDVFHIVSVFRLKKIQKRTVKMTVKVIQRKTQQENNLDEKQKEVYETKVHC